MTRASGVLFCGGGTGGHVFPGLAVAEACREAGMTDLRWIGDPERLEATAVPARGIPLLPIGLSRPRIRSPKWIAQALRRAWACWRELGQRPPLVVVALGGYAALLPGLLAPWRRRPVVVLEQNAHAGRTNRLLSRRADAVVVQFGAAVRRLPAKRCHVLGNPVRPLAPSPHGRGNAQRLRVLVMGGSLAARSVNDLLIAAAPGLAAHGGIELVHLAGEADQQRVSDAYAKAGLNAEVLGFVDDMAAVYERVDLALSRAGATSVAECCNAGLGAVYIPLPWAAEDHQTANARAVAAHGGAVVISQDRAHPAGLVRLMARLANNRHEVAQLGRGALAMAKPHAAADVVALLQTIVSGSVERVGRHKGEKVSER